MSPSAMPPSPSPEENENDFFSSFGEDFVKSPEHMKASVQTMNFDGLLEPPLLLHEDLAAGCGGMLWPAGKRLAKYLLKVKRDEIREAESMCVAIVELRGEVSLILTSLLCSIELGAGGGLVG